MENKRVLILGAGLVPRPMVRYLLERGFSVTVASRTVSKAQALIEGHPLGRAEAVVTEDSAALHALVARHDLTVSLLPATKHLDVAKACLAHSKPLVTTSYVSPAMKELDEQAKQLGVLLLNECGLDPGIDHMSALQVIAKVKAKGGRIDSFISWCGGLPAAEANDNPWYYKFSWAPRGVLVAATSPAVWLEKGEMRQFAAGQLFRNYRLVDVPGGGTFESYPNRDSASYIPLYGIEGTRTMLRGTMRHQGHCARWDALVRLNLFEVSPELDWAGKSYADMLRARVPGSGDLKHDTAAFLGFAPDSDHIKAMEWLGLFDATPIPVARGGHIDVMADLLQRKLFFAPGERDLVVLKHEFVADYPAEKRQESITATMVDFGIPNGDSSMARTVSLPAAVAVKRILSGEMPLPGVHRPILPEIYDPLLAELAELGITVQEHVEPLRG
jgi:saccharopine dehydrogenase-like NADP-dependent oxidoreductase